MGLVTTLCGIGIGPGDPELITLKGWRRLQQARVIAFPAGLQKRRGIAEEIISPYKQPQQIYLPLEFPYVLEQDILKRAWQKAADQVYAYLAQGTDVVFVSEGDVSFYSTFSYLAAAVQNLDPHIALEVIPGVCSPLAAAASLGVPLTLGRERLAILPAMYHGDELPRVWAWAEVVVLMKVRSVYGSVWHWLKEHNLLEQAAVVSWATTPKQQIYTPLTNYPELTLPYFSLLIVWKRRPILENVLECLGQS
ncbi:cobalt-precorrin-2 C20-methyltransferase CbiL [Thermosynechococcus sp. NK55a]|jgi:precorrin-2/cobalt-factor-2 C20-methyltransferase|nr:MULTISPECIES: precorrin-2 C(20)-methyltransferase [unclassified Thermosynechococcus]AHB87896.1 cobalt-precorrin-2 C20-methyltransferase CbiL [Thermosynechococcus sp. NK55a]HIK23634.1 precorrin-2 C(20)-methyltransferase [Thermosynechococcus sp. M3746_W2019_013]